MNEVWSKEIETPASEIIDATIEAIKNPPESIDVKLTLKGIGAARYNFVRVILQKAFHLGEEDIAAYIFRCGAEREIERLAAVFPKDLEAPTSE